MLPCLSLVLGGAASGKSAFAEKMIVSSDLDRVYIATSQVRDEEMRQKIDKHVAQRGAGWTTIEAPLDVAAALAQLDASHAVLLDCATLWLTNMMLGGHDLGTAQAELLAACVATPAPVVVVSNEVGQGIVPDNALARQFREAQGRLNIALAAQANCVVHVLAGLPHVRKGEMP
ncbi:MAG: bifunctional adenosylcobinamide kinase/adenosylcobinamide-phosphate guanylyltransferase [Pseudomonadota bacterium]